MPEHLRSCSKRWPGAGQLRRSRTLRHFRAALRQTVRAARPSDRPCCEGLRERRARGSIPEINTQQPTNKRSCRSADDPRMQVCLLKSKIHRATITDGNRKYEGSLTIAADVIEKCALTPYEGILCSNMANGNRIETYAIPVDPGSGQIVLNGAAAFKGKRGDVLTIM